MKTKKDLIIPFTWEERRPVFLERFFYLPKQYDHGAWDEQFVWEETTQPIYLEICSGNGQWIGEQAQKRPDIYWVALEMDFARARTIWLKIHREKIPNLYVVCAEALTFLEHYAPAQSVSHAFVNFPDPWPKRHHAKHRLIKAPFAERLKTAMKPEGTVTLATDHAPYRDQMIQTFNAAPGWASRPISMDPASYGQSFFAALWQGKGKSIHYLRYAHES
ncbi:MAG TPA: hypothetical protein VGM34_01750 [Chlamydiales bacterium]|jgi:tRNA (guanine-N7-)-methyltransferase